MPTIKDVARAAGVSIATVSYVLNDKNASISEETRRRVWLAIEETGYKPNVTARNLRSNQSRLIGYAWHDIPDKQINPVLDRFTYFLAQAAEAAGYHILTFTYPANNPLEVYDELIRTGRVDGFVVASTVNDDVRIRYLLDQEVPFVCFGRSNPTWDFPYVDTDGRDGMKQMVDYLLALGHTRIAMVAWPEDSLSGSYRVAGYRDALQTAGIELRDDYLVRGVHSAETGRHALQQWLALPPAEQPTAVVAITDLIAIGVMNEAQEHGLIVGRDLSVVGYDDVPLSQFLQPALTTMRQPIPEITQALIDILEALLCKQEPAQRRLLLPPELIVRASAAPPIK